jgi:hypothetical protein
MLVGEVAVAALAMRRPEGETVESPPKFPESLRESPLTPRISV